MRWPRWRRWRTRSALPLRRGRAAGARRRCRTAARSTCRRCPRSIGALLPDDAIVVDEAVTASVFIQEATIGAGEHDYLYLTGGAIGWGLPAATGAAVGAPGRPVVCLEADGSAMYTIQALWTQAREGLDVTTIIVANRSYAILEFEFPRVGAEGDGEAAHALMDIGRPELDFAAMARSMGVPARRVDDVPGLVSAFREALGRARPAPDRGGDADARDRHRRRVRDRAATAELLRSRGARVIVLDRSVAEGDDAIRGRRDRRRGRGGRGWRGRAAAGRARRRGQQRRRRRAGDGRGQRRRRVAPGVRRQRRRDGAGRARRAAATCASRRAAAIVNTCSVAATAGIPNRALYSASKGAVMSLTLAMAADHVARGHPRQLRLPGHGRHARGSAACSTPPTTREAERAALEARQPIGRLVSAGEVAEAIAYLASPASASTTGTALFVDGGMQGLRLRK